MGGWPYGLDVEGFVSILPNLALGVVRVPNTMTGRKSERAKPPTAPLLGGYQVGGRAYGPDAPWGPRLEYATPPTEPTGICATAARTGRSG